MIVMKIGLRCFCELIKICLYLFLCLNLDNEEKRNQWVELLWGRKDPEQEDKQEGKTLVPD